MDLAADVEAWSRTSAAAASLIRIQRAAGTLMSSVTHTAGIVLDRVGISTLFGVTCQDDHYISSRQRDANLSMSRTLDDDEQNLARTTKKLLRLCVHHGEDMPAESTFIQVVVEPNLEAEKMFTGQVASASRFPIWDFTVEHECRVRKSRPPAVELKVMSPRLMGPRHLGSALLHVSVLRDEGVQREDLIVKSTPSAWGWAQDKRSKISVAWQLCDPDAFKPQLSLVAEMSALAMERRRFFTQVEAISLNMYPGSHAERGPIWIRLVAVQLVGAADVLLAISSLVSLVMLMGSEGGCSPSACWWAVFGDRPISTEPQSKPG
ncbi:unnamed protein product [Effrenium voratum]|nr:unnamed protein product [Effrenium voratum]